ncbi:amidohydrolase-domain-containing protein [Cyathus striatus]|nr:amidohydrolase-domain-containing protein [Cyathus striatus]
MGPAYPKLYKTAFTFPAIDNHAHPLLGPEHRHRLPFEGLVSEAEGEALDQDAVHTLACFRATAELGTLLGLGKSTSWNDIKRTRAEMDYMELCKKCFEPTGIQCILIDDGLGGVRDLAKEYSWHDQFTQDKTLRIIRVEVVAEVGCSSSTPEGRNDRQQEILEKILEPHMLADALDVVPILGEFTKQLLTRLTDSALDKEVAGFKSIVCYRTGLDIATYSPQASYKFSLLDVFKMYKEMGKIRLAHKSLNDHVVRIALQVAGNHGKPVVLLHSAYPYTREAGYLTAVYSNVYLDFGEIFPFVSGGGQRTVIRQLLELTPTNKLLWSTDGHWWPESYYLGTMQARNALYQVLSEMVQDKELSEDQGVLIIKNALFNNANRVYNLELQTPPERDEE